MKPYLLGCTLDELTAVVTEMGLPKFTAKQLADWMYKKRVTDINAMSNLSVKTRQALIDRFGNQYWEPLQVQVSADGTKKYLFKTPEENYIEAVYIPDSDRATLCVSSQAGCKMGCKFCMTARQGFQQNLTAAQILAQICCIPETHELTNLVYMGMGEPFDNIGEVLRSLEIITADYGFAWSPKRVTVSTIGILPGMKRFLDESSCHLAISLHNPFGNERNQLMPMQKAYPLADTVKLLHEYDFTGQRRVSFEYIMFDGVNDSPAHAAELVRLLRGIECRMNLIRFHPIPDSPLRCSPPKVIDQFKQLLNDKGIITTVRASRGMDILAACGMLSTKERNNVKNRESRDKI